MFFTGFTSGARSQSLDPNRAGSKSVPPTCKVWQNTHGTPDSQTQSHSRSPQYPPPKLGTDKGFLFLSSELKLSNPLSARSVATTLGS
eukprot:4684936-Amphidinium_carterae.1